MTELAMLHDKEYKAIVPVTFSYRECTNTESANYSLHQGQALRMYNLSYSESYDFDLIVTASPYLVNGEKKSNLHHIIDCYYQENPISSYYKQRRPNYKIIEDDIESAARLAAPLGVDAVMKHHYGDKPFIARERPVQGPSKEGSPLRVRIMRQAEENMKDVELHQRRVTKKEDLVLRTPALKGRPIPSLQKDEFWHCFQEENAFILLHIGTPKPF